MDLLELDGKQLFRRYAIPVPVGGPWPERPPIAGPFAVKAQIPAGKRGKLGGILFADDWEQASRAAQELLNKQIAGHQVQLVYVEEQLAIAREFYLALMLDRDAGRAVLIASPEGGADIESVPQEHLLRLPIEPLLGLRPFHVQAIARFLDPTGAVSDQAMRMVERLYRLFIGEDATLTEINPLVVTQGGELIAADAKIVLDDNARWRHPEWVGFRTHDTHTEFERTIAAAGAVGIEVDRDGEVLAVISGAGLMMATLDLLAGAGCRVRGVIDLGGSVLAGGEALERVFHAVVETGSTTVFLNAFMQTALCDELARLLAAAHAAAPLPGRVVIRLKGRNSAAGRRILADCGFEVYEDLHPAITSLTGSLTGDRAARA